MKPAGFTSMVPCPECADGITDRSCGACLGTGNHPRPIIGTPGCNIHGIFPFFDSGTAQGCVRVAELPCPECWTKDQDDQTRTFISERLRLQENSILGFHHGESEFPTDAAFRLGFPQGVPAVISRDDSLDMNFRMLCVSIRLVPWCDPDGVKKTPMGFYFSSHGATPCWMEFPR